MRVDPNKVVKLTGSNPDRVYLLVQNLNTTSSDYLYLMQGEEEPDVFKNQGLVVGGMGIFEMQNCLNIPAKKSWYAYTTVTGGVDVRVVDI
jgi:hypothetical protein